VSGISRATITIIVRKAKPEMTSRIFRNIPSKFTTQFRTTSERGNFVFNPLARFDAGADYKEISKAELREDLNARYNEPIKVLAVISRE
jgi:hypothetical protein